MLTGSLQAQVYQEYRNFMINKHREDQSKRLTFTDARTLLAGDVNGILRVWTFLDSWGLINFSAKEPPPADNLGPAPFQLAPSGVALKALWIPPPDPQQRAINRGAEFYAAAYYKMTVAWQAGIRSAWGS